MKCSILFDHLCSLVFGNDNLRTYRSALQRVERGARRGASTACGASATRTDRRPPPSASARLPRSQMQRGLATKTTAQSLGKVSTDGSADEHELLLGNHPIPIRAVNALLTISICIRRLRRLPPRRQRGGHGGFRRQLCLRR